MVLLEGKFRREVSQEMIADRSRLHTATGLRYARQPKCTTGTTRRHVT
jgi:hypothetical protein